MKVEKIIYYCAVLACFLGITSIAQGATVDGVEVRLLPINTVKEDGQVIMTSRVKVVNKLDAAVSDVALSATTGPGVTINPSVFNVELLDARSDFVFDEIVTVVKPEPILQETKTTSDLVWDIQGTVSESPSGVALVESIPVSSPGTSFIPIDLIFCVDTTGSMGPYIHAVKVAAVEIINQIATDIPDFRISVVDYRDFPEFPYGRPGLDYEYNDVQAFTTSQSAAVAGINALSLGDGQDWEESVYSALMHCIDSFSLGGWRPAGESKRVIIIMADAPPHDPEPFTGYVAEDVCQAAIEADAALIYPVVIGGDSTAHAYFQSLAECSGGEVFDADNPGEVVEAIEDALEVIAFSPNADAGGPYSGYVGETILCDASGSSDPDGEIVLYEWDWESDGTFDEVTTEPILEHIWHSEFIGTLTVRATDNDGRSDTDTTDIEVIFRPLIPVALDIKPTSCPNPFNVTAKGVLPVAILGSESLDVSQIDVASLRLESVAAIRSNIEDVASPIAEPEDCDCTTAGPDGILDLTLKFSRQELVDVIGDVEHDDVLPLAIEGTTLDGVPIVGQDCIVIRGRHLGLGKADTNDDGVVDFLDLLTVSEKWLQKEVLVKK